MHDSPLSCQNSSFSMLQSLKFNMDFDVSIRSFETQVKLLHMFFQGGKLVVLSDMFKFFGYLTLVLNPVLVAMNNF